MRKTSGVCRSGLYKRKEDIRSVGNFHLLYAYFSRSYNTQLSCLFKLPELNLRASLKSLAQSASIQR